MIQALTPQGLGRPLLAVAALSLSLALVQCGDTGPQIDLSHLVTINNTQPVARTVPGNETPVGVSTALDGTPSYDPDGDEITYQWVVESVPSSSAMGDSPFSVNGTRPRPT